MSDYDKTKAELIQELEALRQQLSEQQSTQEKHTQADNDLKKSSLRLQSIVQALPGRAVIINAAGYYVDILKSNHPDGHYRPDDVIGKSLYEVQNKEFADFCMDTIQTVLANNGLEIVEYSMVNWMGNLVYHEGHITPYVDIRSDEVHVLWVSREITKRKHAEMGLHKNERRLRTFINTLPDRAVVLNAEGRYLELIKRRIDTGNHQVENVIGKTIADIFDKEFTDFCLEMIQTVIKTGDIQTVEYDLIDAAGQPVTQQAHIAPLYDEDNDETNVLWVSRDITERKNAARALQKSEERLRTFMSILPDRAVILNDKGLYVDVVKEHDSSGITQPSNVLGRTLHDALPKELADYCLARIHETLENNKTLVIEYDFLDYEGNHLYQEGRIAPWDLDDVDEARVLWISRDITGRKKAEMKLRASEERLRTFINILPDRAVILNQDGLYLSVLKRHHETGNYQPEGVEGKTIFEVQPPDFAKFSLSMIQKTVETKTLQIIEYDLINPLGQHVYYQGHVAPLYDEDTGETNILWVSRDITARKKVDLELEQHREHLEKLVAERTVALEQEIAERKQLEAEKVRQERLAAVGQLAAGIAHDFNNVMGVIMLDSSLVLRSKNLTEREHTKLERIQNQARHAANLIEQILDFSRRSEREPVTLDLRILLSDLIQFLQRTIPERIEVALSYTQEKFTVNVDPTQFQQVVTNLAVNAKDAIDGNGKLSFRLSLLSLNSDDTMPISEMQAGEWVQLQIVDTGQGIEEEVVSNIFEPFFTTKEVGKGTGLGLAQVHGIVHQHDGFITVESALGIGTTFTIYFPIVHDEVQESSVEDESDLELGHGETILLVEDNSDLLEALCDLLESLDYRVLSATNGEEALQVYEEYQDQIDLVLSDVVMPRMDGAELVRHLQVYEPLPKIIMMSGFRQGTAITPEIEAAVIAWLPKPLDMTQLADLIQASIASKAASN